MKPGFAKIRLARGIGSDLIANAFELSATNVLEVLTFRRSGRGLVEINRNLVALPDLLPDMARHGDAVFNADALNWNKRHNVGCPEPGMRALMLIQIDELCGFPNPTDRRFLDWFALSDERDHAAVVVGVHLAVEKIDAVEFHGLDNGVNFGFVPAFREIRDTFNQSLHKPEEYLGGVGAAREGFNGRDRGENPRSLLRKPLRSCAGCTRLSQYL